MFNIRKWSGKCSTCGTVSGYEDRYSMKFKRIDKNIVDFIGICGHSLCIVTWKKDRKEQKNGQETRELRQARSR